MASLFCRLTNVTMHACVREGGNVKVLQCKYERIFRGNGTFVLLVDICDCACICQRERESGNFEA